MQLKCPACGYGQSGAHQAWRLETCPRCHDAGREVYLAEAATLRRGRRFRPRPLPSLTRVAQRLSRPTA